MYKKHLGEKNNSGVSPVVAVILMVAITVVLTGLLYVWVQNTASTTEENIAYMGIECKVQSDDWKVEIKKVTGSSISLNEINIIITDRNGIVRYSKNLNDVNPPNFMNDNSMLYPLANNTSAVISSETAQPVTANDDVTDYVGAVFLFIDFDNDLKLTSGDVIRIYGDVNGDGINDIHSGYYFIIKDSLNTQQYVKHQL
jgi:flagellin-like protein